MAQPLVTGPVQIWVGLNNSNRPLFLGYAERWPRIQFRNRMRDVFTDRLGSGVPQDKLRQAGDAIVVADLTFIEEITMARLADVCVPKRFTNGMVGTLVNMNDRNQAFLDGTSFPIWLPFRYSSKPAMRAVGDGYHFFAATCLNDDLDQMGTLPMRRRLVFHCIPKYVPVKMVGAKGTSPGTPAPGSGLYDLYDDDVSDVVSLCPTGKG